MSKDFVRVAAYTGGVSVPSARYRVRQYVDSLKSYGVNVHEFVPMLGSYPIGAKIFRPAWALCSLAERSTHIVRSFNYDVTLLQREMLSTLVTLEPMTKAPRILDVDDAIWLRAKAKSTAVLAGLSQLVICGNSFLADQFSRWNSNVVVVPTAVNTDVYQPVADRGNSDRLIIGWSGTSGGFRYLYDIENALAQVLRMYSNARLRVVSDRVPRFRRIPQHKVEFVKWNPDAEIASIQRMDVGIMPLRDTDWERGKCSLKMLTYMSCEVPVVVSNVGTNVEILRLGNCGFGVNSDDEWICGISDLLSNRSRALRFGQNGRDAVQQHYSVAALSPRVADIFKKMAIN